MGNRNDERAATKRSGEDQDEDQEDDLEGDQRIRSEKDLGMCQGEREENTGRYSR